MNALLRSTLQCRLGSQLVRIYWLRVLTVLGLGLTVSVVGIGIPGLASLKEWRHQKSLITYPDLSEQPDPKAEALSERLRTTRVTLRLESATLSEALVTIGARTGISIVPDRAAMVLLREPKANIDLALNAVSARAALDQILSAAPNLIAIVESDHVRVTDLRVSNERRRLEIYPVHDILRLDRPGAAVSIDAEKLQELIERTLGDVPDTCVDICSAGTSEDGALGARLLVRAPICGHRKVVRLLRRMRVEPSSPLGQNERIRRRLRSERVTLHVTRRRVDRVLCAFAEQVGVPISLSALLQGELGPVTLATSGLSGERTLALILAQGELRSCVQGGTLVILLAGAKPLDVEMRFYRLDGILADYRDRPERAYCLTSKMLEGPLPEPKWLSAMGPDWLRAMVIEGTGEDQWGGEANIEVHRNHLIVDQTPEMHVKVERLLAKLRKHRWVYPNPRYRPSSD